MITGQRKEILMNNRTLGTIAMICAPALLIEGLLLRGEEDALITGIASMVFMAGWICTNIGMWRMRATGTGRWGRAVLLVQLVGLVLAFLFGFIEATGLLDENNIVFIVTDIAWPLSMLWMLVVGITVIVTKQLPGWKRFVPVLCPLWLPIAIVGSTAPIDFGFVGLGLTAVLWALLGYIVREGGQQPVPAPEPAVR